VIADSALTVLDQRLIQVDAMLNAANEMNDYLSATKADNIILDEEANTIQLSANGVPIGEAVARDGENASGMVYVPEIDRDKVLSWTVQAATENMPMPDPVDLNPADEWIEDEADSEYEWEDDA
jgi:hypothetical protein